MYIYTQYNKRRLRTYGANKPTNERFFVLCFRFSGVTKDHLKHVDTTLENIHEIFMNLFDSDTILMGHSLESDLKALKVGDKYRLMISKK